MAKSHSLASITWNTQTISLAISPHYAAKVKRTVMIKEVFQKTVKEELAKTNNSKWGADESLAVIIALIVDNTGEPAIAEDKEFVAAIKEVINPSQFAQKLESKDLLKRAEGKRAKNSSMLDGFGK